MKSDYQSAQASPEAEAGRCRRQRGVGRRNGTDWRRRQPTDGCREKSVSPPPPPRWLSLSKGDTRGWCFRSATSNVPNPAASCYKHHLLSATTEWRLYNGVAASNLARLSLRTWCVEQGGDGVWKSTALASIVRPVGAASVSGPWNRGER